MKKFLILAMSLMLALPASVCANEPAFSWQEALENAKQNTRRGITLKSYKVQGKIRSEARLEKLIDSWYSDESYIVPYNYNHNESSKVVVVNVGAYRKINKLVNADFDRTKGVVKSQIENLFANDKDAITLVELLWEVDGRTFNTVAAVSDKYNFIFDKIGSYVIVDSDIKSHRHNEQLNGESKCSISMSEYAKNVFGIDAYNYDLNVSATFNKDGILIDRSSRAVTSQSAGWQCETKANFMGGEIDKSKYTDYEISYHILGAISRRHNENGTLR